MENSGVGVVCFLEEEIIFKVGGKVQFLKLGLDVTGSVMCQAGITTTRRAETLLTWILNVMP
jgi:hypothetical protein